MRRSEIIQKVTSPDWLSFSTEESATGYSIFETQDRFFHERLAERTLCGVGIAAILLGYFVWFLPDSMTPDHPVMTRLTLSVICIGTGIALYFFASRGFRKVVHLDLSKRKLSLAHVNTKQQSLFGYNYNMEEIDSIFVRRGVTEGALASLHIRVAGMPVSLKLLHGLQDELEELHGLLCRDIHSALDCAPKRVQKPIRSGLATKTRRPGKRRKARKKYAVSIPVHAKTPQIEEPAPVVRKPILAEGHQVAKAS